MTHSHANAEGFGGSGPGVASPPPPPRRAAAKKGAKSRRVGARTFDVAVDLVAVVQVPEPEHRLPEDVQDVALHGGDMGRSRRRLGRLLNGAARRRSAGRVRRLPLLLQAALPADPAAVQVLVVPPGELEARDAAPLSHEGGDEPQLRPAQERPVHPEKVGVRRQPHGVDLVPDLVQVGLGALQVEHLDRHLPARRRRRSASSAVLSIAAAFAFCIAPRCCC
jgi:hypothetical protein